MQNAAQIWAFQWCAANAKPLLWRDRSQARLSGNQDALHFGLGKALAAQLRFGEAPLTTDEKLKARSNCSALAAMNQFAGRPAVATLSYLEFAGQNGSLNGMRTFRNDL